MYDPASPGCIQADDNDVRGARVLTNKGKYGLKAMVHLAGLASGETAMVADIAAKNEIPKKFLDAILAELRNAGLVRSKKGRNGGYALSRLPASIMVGQIVRALDGPLAPIRCASTNYYEPCLDCPSEKVCSVHLVMLEVRNAVADLLDNRTLEEMRSLSEAPKRRSPLPLASAQVPASPKKPPRIAAAKPGRTAADNKRKSRAL
jgi:Rrf2 family protein